MKNILPKQQHSY